MLDNSDNSFIIGNQVNKNGGPGLVLMEDLIIRIRDNHIKNNGLMELL